jgi:hypothetical protein
MVPCARRSHNAPKQAGGGVASPAGDELFAKQVRCPAGTGVRNRGHLVADIDPLGLLSVDDVLKLGYFG